MKVWQDETLNFKDLVLQDKRILKVLSQQEIEKVFDVKYYLKNIDKIFERVFSD